MIDSNGKIYIQSEDEKIIQIEEIKNIVYLEADNRKTKVYCFNGNQYLINKCLSYIEERITNKNFFKIHKSFIINVDYLKSVNYKGEKNVVLENDIKIQIACRKYPEFKRFLKEKFSFFQ